MALEALKEIEEIEKKADAEIAEARLAAKRLTDEAQVAAAKKQAETREKIREKTLDFLKEQEALATKIMEQEKAKTEILCEEIKSSVSEKMDRAVADIIERVVNA